MTLALSSVVDCRDLTFRPTNTWKFTRIALLDAGSNAVDHPKVNDVSDGNAWRSMLQDGLVVDYSITPQEHLGHCEIPNPVGRLLTGSSGVNVGN
jgi:hypothetical protein